MASLGTGEPGTGGGSSSAARDTWTCWRAAPTGLLLPNSALARSLTRSPIIRCAPTKHSSHPDPATASRASVACGPHAVEDVGPGVVTHGVELVLGPRDLSHVEIRDQHLHVAVDRGPNSLTLS